MSDTNMLRLGGATALLLFLAATTFVFLRSSTSHPVSDRIVWSIKCVSGLGTCYQKHVPTPHGQAVHDLKTIGAGIAMYAEDQLRKRTDPDVSPGIFPQSAGPTPAAVCCGQECSDSWTDPVWREQIRFARTSPGWYQYQVQRKGEREAVVIAHGDVDCNGVTAEFKLSVTVNDAREVLVSSVTMPENWNE